MNRSPLVLAAGLMLTATLAAQSAQLWVDAKNGKDTNLGTRAQPFKTLTFALKFKTTDAVVHVLPGTYGPATTGDFWDATAKTSKFIRLANYKNFKLVGTDRSNCIIDFNNNTGQWGYLQIRGANSDGVEVSNLTFKNCPTNTPWGNGAIAVDFSAKNVDIHGCYFENTNSTVIIWGGFDVAFHDNLIVSTTPQTGVAVRIRVNVTKGDRAAVYNNVIYQTRHGISWSNSANNATQWVCNNVVLAADRCFPDTKFPKKLTAENNIAFGGKTVNFGFTPMPKSNRVIDPKLADPGKGDFRQKAGSPCFEAGYAKGLPFMVNDFFGNARAADADADTKATPDIGIQEIADVGLDAAGFGQGKTATFTTKKLRTFAGPGIFFFGWKQASLVLDPFGSFGIDPAGILFTFPITVPGTLKLPMPADPKLTGIGIFVQALGWRPTARGNTFKPSGRLDLYL